LLGPRRTAATIAGRWFSDAEIAPCLDHQPTKDANGKPLPAVTGRHYNHAQRKNMQLSCAASPASRCK
jgi:hypothetical protein